MPSNGRTIIAIALFTLSASMLRAQPAGADALLPIQRILVTPERAAKELEKAPSGGLVLWPLAQFEGRLDKARKLMQAREQVPTLTRASYKADLVGRSLINGRGNWTVQHQGPEPGLLPIDPFNLALHQLTWKKGGAAVVAAFNGKTLGLLVKHTGTQVCEFTWSARGIPASDGIAFKLAVPPCALTTFAFKLPADQWLFVPKGVAVVTGPHETEPPSSQRLWTLQATGQTNIDLTIRTVTNPKGPAPTMFARVASTQILAPDRISLEHDFQIDILHGSVRELTFETESPLQPFKVTLKGGEIKDWSWTENVLKKDAKGKPIGVTAGVLWIEFNQPVQGKIQGLRIESVAPQPMAKANVWTSPALHLRNAQWRGETLTIHLHPSIQAARWDAGTFQHLDIKMDDNAQVVTLADTAPAPAASRRPSLQIDRQTVDVHTTERHDWHITPRGADLDAEIDYAVTRGSLFELIVQLPKKSLGYQVVSLDLFPADLLKSWHPAGETLIVELKQALAAGKKATLKIQMRSRFPAAVGGRLDEESPRTLLYPELEPKNVGKREGAAAFRVDATLQPQLLTSSAPPAPFNPALREQRVATPSYAFVFRKQSLSASLRVVPVSVQMQWRGKHFVTLSEQEARLRFRWEIEPIAGAPEYFDLRFAPNFPANWNIVAEEGSVQVHHWERLGVLQALPHLLRSWFQPALLEAALPKGVRWRIYLAEPMRKKATFAIEATIPAGMLSEDWRRMGLLLPNANPWEVVGGVLASEIMPRTDTTRVWAVPLVVPVHGTKATDEVAVAAPLELIQRAMLGGTELLARPADLGVHEHSFKVSPSLPSPELTLWTRPEKRSTSTLERCDEASLATYVYADGRVFHRIEFRLWHWRERTCELKLPPDFDVVAASVRGQALERLEVKQGRAETRVVLPVDQNAGAVRCAVLVRAPSRLLFGLADVEIPAIEWPAPPLLLRKRLYLERGLMPLDQEAIVPVGVPRRLAEQTPALRHARRVWSWGSDWLPFQGQAALQDRLDTQKQNVLAKEADLRSAGHKALKLSEALERFAFYHWKGPLVLDLAALRELGIDHDTPIPPPALSPQADRPFWESIGLTVLPCPSGALLTSPARLQQLGIHENGDILELDAAVAEALLHGRDASAGFALILNWLRPAADEESMSAGIFDSHLGEPRDMTEWTLRSGDVRTFTIVEPARARIFAWLPALLLALTLWKVQRTLTPINGFRLHVGLLTVSILLLIWLPSNVREYFAWPAFLVELAACLWSLARLAAERAPRVQGGQTTVAGPAPTIAASLVLALVGVCGALAQPAEPRTFTVFIVEGAKPTAILTPDLIARFDELDNQPPVGTQNAVLVSATYAGTVTEATAHFTAQLELISFKDQTNLLLPLTGVQLQEGVFLDGAPVFPTAQKNGYLIPIRDKGVHRLRLSFTARVLPAGDHVDMKFTVPKLAQNELSVQWSAPVQSVHLIHGAGAEERGAGPGQTVRELRAQLGYEGTVYLRWTDAAKTPAGQGIEVREAHFWDLRPGALGLVSSLHYAIGKSTLTQLRVTLPEGLQVRAVEALAVPQLPSAAPVVVKNWQIFEKGGPRRLVIDFAQPVSGNVLLNVETFPPFSPRATDLLLPLPGPLQGTPKGGIVGYRLDALELRSTEENLSVQGLSAADFEQLWKKHTAKVVPPASHAYKFLRKDLHAGLKLKVQPDSRQARFDLDWTVDLHHADLRGKFTFTSPFEDITFIEFAFDKELTLTDVVGPDVARWTIHDLTLHVWLKIPRKQVDLEVRGWRTLPYPGKTPFRLPALAPVGGKTTAAFMQLHPGAGIEIDVEQQKRVRPYGAKKLPLDALGGASFSLRLGKQAPATSLLTKVERTEHGIVVWQRIRLTTERGTLPALKLHARNWIGEDLIFDAPGAAVQRLKDPGARHAVWTIEYPAKGLPQEVFITLRSDAGVDKLAQFTLPTVELEKLPFRTSWVAWKDVELLNAITGRKLAHQLFVKEQVAMLRDEERFGDQPGWSYADRPAAVTAFVPKTPARTSAQILSATEDVFLDSRQQWTHALNLLIYTPDATELRLRFPAEVAEFTAFGAQNLLPTRSLSARQAALLFEADARPREIRLKWTYAASAERPELPNLAAVLIEPEALPAHARRLWVPAGMRANLDWKPNPSRLAELLDAAEAQAQLSAVLAQHVLAPENPAKAIQASQHDFFAAFRQAEYLLGALKSIQADFDEARWHKRLNDVKSTNDVLATKHRFERQRDAAAKARRAPLPTAARNTIGAEGVPWLVSTERPLTPLRSPDADVHASVRTRSEWLLLGGVFLFVVSYFRRGMAFVRRILPELGILAIVALLVWQGLSLLGVGVIVLIVMVRLATLPLWLRPGSTAEATDAGEPPQGPTVIQTSPPAASS